MEIKQVQSEVSLLKCSTRYEYIISRKYVKTKKDKGNSICAFGGVDVLYFLGERAIKKASLLTEDASPTPTPTKF